jgi:hypothetical protein
MTLGAIHNLQPADVIITPKSNIGLVQHFVVFECLDYNGVDWYLENKQGYGVRRIDGATFERENRIVSIRCFSGNENQRNAAISRAQSLIGRDYNLLNFNCEHYAIFVHTGTPISEQVASVGKAVGAIALLVGIGAILNAAFKE